MSLALDGTPQFQVTSTSVNANTVSTTFAHGKVIVFTVGVGCHVTSITDTAGLSYSQRISYSDHDGHTDEEWQADIGASALSSNVVTVNFSGTSSTSAVMVFCLSNGGLSSGLAFDSGGPQTGPGTYGTGVSMTTATAASLVYGMYRYDNTSAPVYDAADGWSPIISGVAGSYELGEYKVLSSAGSITLGTGTGGGGGDQSGAIIDAVIVGSGGGGFTPKFRKTLSPVGTRIGARQMQNRARFPRRDLIGWSRRASGVIVPRKAA